MRLVIGFNNGEESLPESLRDQAVSHTVTAGPGEIVVMDGDGTPRVVPATQNDTDQS